MERESSRTPWAARAAALYTDTYAAAYRAHDDQLAGDSASVRLAAWLRRIGERFDRPIDALDLGCGTGRYFHAVAAVRSLLGIDASRPMLDRARHPAGGFVPPPGWLTLVEGDFLTHEFEAGAFDLVYAIGVLAEHSPLDEHVAARVAHWLRPGGRFAFTTVHPESPSVPRTVGRSIGAALMRWPATPRAIRQRIRKRLMSGGLYADEARVREVLGAARLTIESIEPFESDVHTHVLTVARKPG